MVFVCFNEVVMIDLEHITHLKNMKIILNIINMVMSYCHFIYSELNCLLNDCSVLSILEESYEVFICTEGSISSTLKDDSVVKTKSGTLFGYKECELLLGIKIT